MLDFGAKSYGQLLLSPHEGYLSMCSLELEDGVVQMMQNLLPVLSHVSFVIFSAESYLSAWGDAFMPGELLRVMFL